MLDVSDEQVIKKTGKKISGWITILDKLKVAELKSNHVVAMYNKNTRFRDIEQGHSPRITRNEKWFLKTIGYPIACNISH